MSWQLQEAKQKFSELVRRALDEGPQIVTRHGESVKHERAVFELVRQPLGDAAADPPGGSALQTAAILWGDL